MNSKNKKIQKKQYSSGGLTVPQLNLTKALESLFGGKDVFPQKFPEGGPLLTSPIVAESTSTNVKPYAGTYSVPNSGSVMNVLEEVGGMIENALPKSMQIFSDTTDAPKQTAANIAIPVKPDSMSWDERKMYKQMQQGIDPMEIKVNPKHEKFRYREKADGGALAEAEENAAETKQGFNAIGSAASVIPVVGQAVGGIVNGIGSMLASAQTHKLKNINPMKLSNNIYGQMEMGGLITKNFKQYHTGSHDSGNDQGVDQFGNQSDMAVGGYIQNNENAYKSGDSAYVMSDTLVNPETGNLFNQDAAKINKKYKKADYVLDEQNAIDFEMKRLSVLNDGMRNLKEQVLKACGGSTKKHADGGPPLEPLQPLAPTLINFNVPNDYTTASLDSFKIDPTTLAADPNRKASKSVRKFSSDNNIDYNTIAAALKGAGAAKSAIDALTPAEKEKPILPDYDKADYQNYLANVDYTQARQDAIAATNLASNMNRSGSTGYSTYQGRQSMNYANLARQLGNVSMQESNQRSQLALQRAGYEANKATDKAGRLYQNRIDNQMNQANADLADQKFFSELTQIGTTFNDYQYYKDQLENNKELSKMKIKESAAILGSKYENFGFDEDFINKMAKGDYEDLDFNEVIRFISTADKVKTKK